MTLDEVRKLAERFHAAQTDKAGRSYIGHLVRVAERVASAGGTEDQQAAALLHDSVEDGCISLRELASYGLPEAVLVIVDAMTKRLGEPTEAYLSRVAAAPGATLVKYADIADNSDPERLALLAPKVADRLRAKYASYRVTLARLSGE